MKNIIILLAISLLFGANFGFNLRFLQSNEGSNITVNGSVEFNGTSNETDPAGNETSDKTDPAGNETSDTTGANSGDQIVESNSTESNQGEQTGGSNSGESNSSYSDESFLNDYQFGSKNLTTILEQETQYYQNQLNQKIDSFEIDISHMQEQLQKVIKNVTDEQLTQFFDAWNQMFTFVKEQNIEEIFANHDIEKMKKLKKELNSKSKQLFFKESRQDDEVEKEDFIQAMRFYKFYLNHEEKFKNYNASSKEDKVKFIIKFFMVMAGLNNSQNDQAQPAKPDQILSEFVKNEIDRRKENQKTLLNQVKNSDDKEKKLDSLKQLMGFESNKSIPLLETQRASKRQSMDTEIMKEAVKNLKDMISSENVQSKEEIKEIVKLQREMMKAQMEDFKQGAFSIEETDLATFKEAAKENAENLRKAAKQFGRFMEKQDQIFDKEIGMFAKKFVKNALDNVTLDSLDFGWNDTDIKGRKLGCRFPMKELKKLFNNSNFTELKTVSAFQNKEEVESFIGGILSDLVEMSLTDENGNPISVQNLEEKIKIQIPKLDTKVDMNNTVCFYLDENSEPQKIESCVITQDKLSYEVETDYLTQFGVKEEGVEAQSYDPVDLSANTNSNNNGNKILRLIVGSLFIIASILIF